jgi:ArsR family transcriptional regulator, arsenate/arsenite/antimonite-responsive transcriptional repressor
VDIQRSLKMNKYEQNALIFKAFCDESRLRIIDLIKQGETCSCVLLEDLTITQPTLSHHMKILIESGLVNARREGKYTMYALSIEGIEEAKKVLDEILEGSQTTPETNCNVCAEK